jgi:ribosomal-protein-alanine N-acetyltransferase
MLELDLSTFPELRTQRLILRELRENDGERLFEMRSDDTVMEYIASRKSSTLDEVLKLIAQVNQDRRNNDCILWGLTLHGDDTLIGTIGFYRLQKEHYRGEIGYLLAKEHWGKGLMNEALIAAVDFGFNQIGFHSIEAVTDPGNERSNAVLLRNGFNQEGLFKENFYWNGKFYDSAVFSRLANDDAGRKPNAKQCH